MVFLISFFPSGATILFGTHSGGHCARPVGVGRRQIVCENSYLRTAFQMEIMALILIVDLSCINQNLKKKF